jgi:hypothetical protein
MVWGTSSVDWALGFFLGAGACALVWVWDAPPTHIDNRRRGAEGERHSARALRALERDGDVVVVDPLDNARGSYRLDRLAPRLRAEAARVKTEVEVTARRTWVQAVVVIWGEFPQRVVDGDRIVFVHGDELVAWLQRAARRAGGTVDRRRARTERRRVTHDIRAVPDGPMEASPRFQ